MSAGSSFTAHERARWLEALPYGLLAHDSGSGRVHANAVGRTLLCTLATHGGASFALANPLPALGLCCGQGREVGVDRRRLSTPLGRLRATALAGAEACVVLVERLVPTAQPGVFVARPWPAPLDATAARLVRLVAEGASNAAIAAALGLSEGTVKSRLHAICKRVGARTRVDLALLYRSHALLRSSPAARAARRPDPGDWARLEQGHDEASLALLERVGFGLAAQGHDGRTLWANRACAELAGVVEADAAPAGGRGRRRPRAGGAAGGRAARREAAPAVEITRWKAGARLHGLAMRPHAPLAPGATEPLRRTGLTRRQAEVAHLLAVGSTNPEIARSLGIARDTADAIVAALYRDLRVTTRVELVNRILDLTR
ncbi:MAG: helix-turn-helix transcriptional regulator [Gemmatimonadales bacterium]|jgi:DNA-binding NarL/FixJ family response regulator|nr:helix-turn-helix transcriptional regulator [Gemmatimonadales bacterium]